MTSTKTVRDVTAEIVYLTRALKAPSLRSPRAARRAARAETWSQEEILAA